MIVYTLTGRASGVGVYLDSLKLSDMLASIAGDDTLLVIPRTISRTKELRDQIATIFQWINSALAGRPLIREKIGEMICDEASAPLPVDPREPQPTGHTIEYEWHLSH